MGTAKFPDRKCGFLFKIKEDKGLRGDVLEYVAQARPQFDTEIGQKDHFRMETTWALLFLSRSRNSLAGLCGPPAEQKPNRRKNKVKIH
jgi:hypothetical protein